MADLRHRSASTTHTFCRPGEAPGPMADMDTGFHRCDGPARSSDGQSTSGWVMADVDVTQELPVPVERPRRVTSGPLAWLRANLFNSVPNTILTVAALYLFGGDDPSGDPLGVDRCDLARRQRARVPRRRRLLGFHCEKGRFILFGRFPYEEHWRPLFVVVIFIAMILASCDRRLWGRRLAILWLAGIAAVGVLMWGGVLGMSYVET